MLTRVILCLLQKLSKILKKTTQPPQNLRPFSFTQLLKTST